jgi:hypothetical protein
MGRKALLLAGLGEMGGAGIENIFGKSDGVLIFATRFLNDDQDIVREKKCE